MQEPKCAGKVEFFDNDVSSSEDEEVSTDMIMPLIPITSTKNDEQVFLLLKEEAEPKKEEPKVSLFIAVSNP